MKLNHFAIVNGTTIDRFGRRKKERDSIRIDEAIKKILDQLDHHVDGQSAFMRLLDSVRRHTPLLKPTSGRGTPGCHTILQVDGCG